MADVATFTNDGTGGIFNVKDPVARTSVAAVSEKEEFDRQAALGVYAGRNLQTVLNVANFDALIALLHSRIASGNFADIRIGDYMNVNCGVYGTQRFDLAHVNPYYRMGSSAMGQHLCFVNNKPIALPSGSTWGAGTNNTYIQWNTTGTNQGTSSEPSPYMASHLKDWENNGFLPAMPSVLTQYLINRWEYTETRYSAGGGLTASTGRAWKQLGKVWSLSEMEVYGATVWGTPGHSVGIDRQLDDFRNIHNQIPERTRWWLRVASGVSAADVCDVGSDGIAYTNTAAALWLRPRLGFLLG